MYEPQYSETQYSDGDAGNGKFLMGLLAGAAIGAAVGLMFAPKSGTEFRQQLSNTTDRWKQKAAETYEQASGTVNDVLAKGRQVAERGREAFQTARQEAKETFPSSTGPGTTGM